jgi:glutaconate CoA-transferase subunit B
MTVNAHRRNGYNPVELLICSASRLMEDNTTAFIGTGIPMLAASLAQKLNAPNLITIFEFGGTGAILDKLPMAVGEQNTFHRALVASGICDIVETAQRGFIEYGFLGGAQIDPYGNLNSTVIGDYAHPKVRLPGSGGGNDVGSNCWQTIAIMRHDRRRFVEKLDFLTTPGYLNGSGAREAAGLPPGTGPYRVVTNLAILGYDSQSKRMMLLATQPGITVEQVIENTGFDLLIADDIGENPPPTEDELRILREEVDRERLYI